MRPLVLLLASLALLPALAACGGGGTRATTSSTSAQPDPGRETLEAVLAASSKKDTAALWSLLSTPSRTRLGPTQAAFRQKSAAVLEHALAPFVGDTVRPLVSQRVSDRFGVVALRRGSNVLALPLRREQGTWKVEWGGPVAIDIGGPQPGSKTLVGQVGVEIHAPGPPSIGLLWVDGQSVEPRVYTVRRSATVFANLLEALPPGVHSAVAYAQEGRDAGATGWTFTALKRKAG